MTEILEIANERWLSGDELCERMLRQGSRFIWFVCALETFRAMHGIAAHIHEDDCCKRHAEHIRDRERCSFLRTAEGGDEQDDDDRIADKGDPRTGVKPCKGS